MGGWGGGAPQPDAPRREVVQAHRHAREEKIGFNDA